MAAKAKKVSNPKTVTRSSKSSDYGRKPYQIIVHVEYDGSATSLADEIGSLIDDPYGYNDGQFGRFNFTVKTLTSDELEKVLA